MNVVALAQQPPPAAVDALALRATLRDAIERRHEAGSARDKAAEAVAAADALIGKMKASCRAK